MKVIFMFLEIKFSTFVLQFPFFSYKIKKINNKNTENEKHIYKFTLFKWRSSP